MHIDPSLLRAFAAEGNALGDWTIAQRRALHSHPELSGQETQTQAYLLARLAELGIPTETYPGQCAVIGLIEGALPGPTVGLRADMDALPIEEPGGCPFASTTPGVMHACGHDAHMAIQLGVAKLLLARRATLPGNIKLLFEHAEETTGGAAQMMAAGCMEQPHVDAVLGLHMRPGMPVGQLTTRIGALSGSSDGIRMEIRGRASHGAYPEGGADAIVGAAQVITALQTLVSRNTSPLDSAVLTIGAIEGGTAGNVICEQVYLRGTLRTLRADTRRLLHRRIAEVVDCTCAAMGCEGRVEISEGYPALVNDAALTPVALEVMRALLGPAHVMVREQPSMGVESFGYFTQAAPGVYYDLGCGEGTGLHTRAFRIDEACLPLAVGLHAAITWALLHAIGNEEAGRPHGVSPTAMV